MHSECDVTSQSAWELLTIPFLLRRSHVSGELIGGMRDIQHKVHFYGKL